MTDAGQTPPPNVNALVEALEARARQAGSEGAMTLLRGMLGTLSESMASIEERLGRIEERANDQSGEMTLAEAVQSALASFNSRLARLEEAFVQAVEESGSGTQQIVDQIREAVMASLPSPALDAPAAHPAPAEPQEPPVSAEEVADGVVAALSDRLAGFDRRLGALERLEDAVRELRDRPPPEQPPPPPPPPPAPAPEPIDLSALARIEEQLAALASLGKDDASARTIALIEERMATLVKVIGERTDDVRGAVQALADRPLPEPPLPPPAPEPLDLSALARIEEELRRLADRPLPEPPLPPPAPEPLDLSALARIEDELRRLADRPLSEPPPRPPPAPEPPDLSALARIEEQLSALTRLEDEVRRLAERPLPEAAPLPPPVAPPPIEIPIYELSDIVHREAELLTQRVAALAVGVEATRALVEQLLADMEASIGHKASEVGRRLAADLGLRTRRNAKRRDRELGPGA